MPFNHPISHCDNVLHRFTQLVCIPIAVPFFRTPKTHQSVPVAPMDTAEIGNIVANNYWPTPESLMVAAQLDGPAKQFVEAM